MTRRRSICHIDNRKSRRGVALVAVIALFAISLTLFGLWANAAVRERQRMASQQFRAQAERLAEAGITRAMNRRAADAKYNKETWSVPAESLGGAQAGEVRIHLLPVQDGAALRYEATAVFPVGAVRHAEITKRIEIPNPTPKDET